MKAFVHSSTQDIRWGQINEWPKRLNAIDPSHVNGNGFKDDWWINVSLPRLFKSNEYEILKEGNFLALSLRPVFKFWESSCLGPSHNSVPLKKKNSISLLEFPLNLLVGLNIFTFLTVASWTLVQCYAMSLPPSSISKAKKWMTFVRVKYDQSWPRFERNKREWLWDKCQYRRLHL